MKTRRTFVIDVGWTFVASATSVVLGFLITVVLGRLLGPEELGVYRFAVTFYGIIALLAAFGVPAAVTKYIAELKRDDSARRSIASSGMTFSILVGILVAGILFFTAADIGRVFRMSSLEDLLKALALSLPFALVGGALLGFFNGLRDMRTYATALILQSATMFGVSVVLVLIGAGVMGAIAANLVSAVLFCIYLLRESRAELKLSIRLDSFKRIGGFGFKIMAANGVNQVNYYVDTILIGYLLTATDLGLYGAAVGLSRMVWIIPQAVQTISYPAASEYWSKRDHEAMQETVSNSMRYTACIVLPISLALGLFAEEVIVIVFGESFKDGALPLAILAIGAGIFGILTSVGGTLQAIGKPGLALGATALVAAIDIVLNLTLIQFVGITGAALATTVSLSLVTVLYLYLIAKHAKVLTDYRWHTRMVGLFLAMLAFGWGLEDFGIVAKVVVILAYLLIVTKFFISSKDWELIRTTTIGLLKREI